MKKVDNNKKYQEEETKKKRKRWLLLLLLLLFLCFFGYIIFRIGFKFGESKQPVTPDPTPVKMIIKVSDNDGTWKKDEQNKIRVFSILNTARDRVAPYDSGVYQFDVKNDIDNSIVYKLSLTETNEDRVNIKYKLKKNGFYVIGKYDWVYYDQVKLEDLHLAANETDNYELEWCWVSENNELDTKIGLKRNKADYTMTINVTAEEVD